MIVYFPAIYPDELFYSVLSRTYAKSGYLSYTQAVEEFFENPKEKLDFQFVNKLKPEIIQHLSQNQSWEKLIINHTMFPYYSRFLGTDIRKKIFIELINMNGNYSKLLSLTPNRQEKEEYLRYCPLCTNEQREKYEEAYWNRIHQIPEISACPIHGCKLINSSVSKNRNMTRYFCPAETEINDMSVEYESEKEILLSRYLYEILCGEIHLENDVQVGKYLVSKMAGTSYLSNRGQIINVGLLYDDMMAYYDGFQMGLQMKWQLSKVLHGKRINPFEIAQIGLFLGIPVSELINPALPTKTPEEIFDERVLSMLRNGISAYEIAKELNVSKSLIHLISKNYGVRNKKYEKYRTRKTENRQQKIEMERRLWISVLKKYPGLSYTQLREMPEYRSRLNWLRRNDKEWTDAHYPTKGKNRCYEK